MAVTSVMRKKMPATTAVFRVEFILILSFG